MFQHLHLNSLNLNVQNYTLAKQSGQGVKIGAILHALLKVQDLHIAVRQAIFKRAARRLRFSTRSQAAGGGGSGNNGSPSPSPI